MDHNYALIMAGGSGTRFWPLSRGQKPKQFLDITGGKPLIAQVFDRIRNFIDVDRIYVIAGNSHKKAILEALPSMNPGNLILEPAARNTAPAIGLATVMIHAKDPDAVMAVMPSDHHIGDNEAFSNVMKAAFKAAGDAVIVTLGITPSRPETGYGYIRKGGSIGKVGVFEIFGVDAFVEKPDRARAVDYVMSGRYLWNSGMFFFRVREMMREIETHLPVVFEGLQKIIDPANRNKFTEMLETVFEKMPNISIDYGIMEKVKGIRVIPASIAWSDVGSWASLPEVCETDGRGNVIIGDVVLIDSDNCVIESKAQIITAVGLHSTAVIVTGDSVLVCPLDRTQDVKKIVAELEKKGREDLL